jgi:hypothetical protein
MSKHAGAGLAEWTASLARMTLGRFVATGDSRHASTMDPWDRELERSAAEKLDQLYDRISDRLEHDFRELTELTTAQQQTLVTIAVWLGLSMPSAPQASELPDPGEARAVWSNVSRAAGVNLLRTASRLALPEAEVGRQSADDFLAMSSLLSSLTSEATLTLDAYSLADKAWAALDRERFMRLTGMSEGDSRLALKLAARELVDWARNQLTVVPHDDRYLIVRARGDDLEIMVTEDRPGLYLWTEQETVQQSPEIIVCSVVGDISKDVEGDVVHATPRIAETLVKGLALTATAPSTSLDMKADRNRIKIEGVDQIKGESARAALHPFGGGWILGEQR